MGEQCFSDSQQSILAAVEAHAGFWGFISFYSEKHWNLLLPVNTSAMWAGALLSFVLVIPEPCWEISDLSLLP